MSTMLLRPSRPARTLCLLSVLVATLLGCFTISASAGTMPRSVPPAGAAPVIVRGEAGALVGIERATRRMGGTALRPLQVIGGFAATIPAARLADLRILPGVSSVTPDSSVELNSAYDPTADTYSIVNTAADLGATAAWAQGITGAGVDVAIIDTGVTPVAGLSGPGKLVNGPDLSFDSQTPSVTHLDAFGHGTFMAGLIAGKDAGADVNNAGSSYLGIAPDARIVNVKVGAANGAVDVSQIIAGIGWVVQHRRDNGMNIRILNLSLGTKSGQGYRSDPLAFAAEVAWRSGIVVVAAAGNAGAGSGTLTDPAYDPNLLAVGASGNSKRSSIIGSGYVPGFSSFGDGNRNPDVLAPGIHLQGLRVPGSYIDRRFPEAAFGGRFFRGSGTSESAAITSGVVALILQKSPNLSPDQVKSQLKQGAAQLPNVAPQGQGAGLIQVAGSLLGGVLGGALGGVFGIASREGGEGQWSPQSQGNGSLELARGGDHLQLNGVALSGEKDIFGHSFQSDQMAWAAADRRSWVGGDWNGTTWTGTTWSGTTWSGTTWSGTTWSGTTWTGTTWTGTTWSGTTWSGTTWSGTTWSVATWSASSWD
jgi:serine protease AprX